MKAKSPEKPAHLSPALTNAANGLIELGVYLIEFDLDDADPKAGAWQMPAIQAGGYWFAASDRYYADGPITVREAGYRVIRHLEASRLTLADMQLPTPDLFGSNIGGGGGA